jgi:hypothetical protein
VIERIGAKECFVMKRLFFVKDNERRSSSQTKQNKRRSGLSA